LKTKHGRVRVQSSCSDNVGVQQVNQQMKTGVEGRSVAKFVGWRALLVLKRDVLSMLWMFWGVKLTSIASSHISY